MLFLLMMILKRKLMIVVEVSQIRKRSLNYLICIDHLRVIVLLSCSILNNHWDKQLSGIVLLTFWD